jgi:hypothetical protein
LLLLLLLQLQLQLLLQLQLQLLLQLQLQLQLQLLLQLLLSVLAVILSEAKDPETFHSPKPIGPFSPYLPAASPSPHQTQPKSPPTSHPQQNNPFTSEHPFPIPDNRRSQ